MDQYRLNFFAPCLILIKYCSFTLSAINKFKFSHDLRDKIQMRDARLLDDLDKNLNDNHQHDCCLSKHDWGLLLNPSKLIGVILKNHQADWRFLVTFAVHWAMLFYLLFKCLFHLQHTGSNSEVARYYDENWLFPRLFESHARPEFFYEHTTVIVLYMFFVRSIALYRLIKFSIVNEHNYQLVTISQINYAYLAHIYMPFNCWFELFYYAYRHHMGYRDRQNKAKVRSHLSFSPEIDKQVAEIHCRELIYHVNQIEFGACYQADFPILYQIEEKTERDLNESFKKMHATWPLHRMDMGGIVLLSALYVGVFASLVLGFGVVLFCSVYFELDGAIREKFQTEWSFMETLYYFPTWLDEPRRLIRLGDLMILTLIQYPNQLDAIVYYSDTMALISRAYKVMMCLEYDRMICNTYKGETELNTSGIILDPKREHSDSQRERRLLNERVSSRIKLTQVLRAEFKDLKSSYTLYLNIVMIFGGLSIAFCISLIMASTSFSTVVAIGLNSLASFFPLVISLVLSVVLNKTFMEINKNLHLLVVNKRGYLNKQTVKNLMIESCTFESERERSIQIAGTISITPESLGPLVAYIATCILMLKSKFNQKMES